MVGSICVMQYLKLGYSLLRKPRAGEFEARKAIEYDILT